MAGTALLRLVRWPGVLTAAADALTATLLFPCTPGRTAAAVAAGALVYAGGVVLNDAADSVRDRTLHPARPVPSGAVSRGAAFAFGALLLAAGIGAAAAAGAPAAAAWAGVAAAAAAYDFLLKSRGLLGAAGMGICRGGNVLAAALTSPAYGELLDGAPGRALLVPLPWFLHGFAVTAASLLEDSPLRRSLVPAAAAGILLPAALAFPLLGNPGETSVGFALAAAALLTFALGRSLARVRYEPTPEAVGALVREGVFGFLLLDAVVLGVRDRARESVAAVVIWLLLRIALRGRRS